LQPESVMTNCIFCDIIAKTAPAEILYEDEQCVVIANINPLAPLHLLIIPRKHIASLNDMTSADESLAGHLLLTAKKMAEKMDIAEQGYRLALNTGKGGGQTVFHLHVHLLGGKPMDDSLLSRGIA
jgi:histidine triad (HIT) family protein